MSDVYIHYGANEFIREKFNPIHNTGDMLVIKPIGGLWASNYTKRKELFNWKDWCIRERFHLSNLRYHFKFTLADNANVVHLKDKSDISALPMIDLSVFDPRAIEIYESVFEAKCVDFEKCVENHIDAIELEDIDNYYWTLHSWDCNCILIMNPDIIVPV